MPIVNFPEPYCDIADAADVSVEEITAVTFAGTSITNTDIATVLIDETTTVVNVAAGETYALVVEGNTAGPFDTNIVAFIDWNQNDTLDDAGEIYELGPLSDTDGTDGVSVTLDITVPTDAVLGTTRIRITKTYTDEDSPADVNACGITFDAFGQGSYASYGQALDFTLSIAPLSVDTFQLNALSVYPVPAHDVLHINYKSSISSVKIYNVLGQEVLAKNSHSNNLQLDVSELASGAYIIKLVSEGIEHTMRILKN
ncbi:T9SS type A sorting domain-containing protein [Bizionia myxarmorum]|uniref:T9SS type A sorting domain-containing protein n=2 Tax=Bizionia myxarmorum TaxID=291186 RepID=A0A5D0QXY6_9FLAO|nr:T9SS type A sorting domain-containing protein [Bizionia myxarmorum]